MDEKAQVSFDYLILLSFIISITFISLTLLRVVGNIVYSKEAEITYESAPRSVEKILEAWK